MHHLEVPANAHAIEARMHLSGVPRSWVCATWCRRRAVCRGAGTETVNDLVCGHCSSSCQREGAEEVTAEAVQAHGVRPCPGSPGLPADGGLQEPTWRLLGLEPGQVLVLEQSHVFIARWRHCALSLYHLPLALSPAPKHPLQVLGPGSWSWMMQGCIGCCQL